MDNNKLCLGNALPQNFPIENRPAVVDVSGPDAMKTQDLNPASSSKLAGLLSNPVLKNAGPAVQHSAVNYPVQALKIPDAHFQTQLHDQPRSVMENNKTHVQNVLSQRFTVGKRPNLGALPESDLKRARTSKMEVPIVDLVSNPFVTKITETINQSDVIKARNSNPFLSQVVDLVSNSTITRNNQCVNEPDVIRARNVNPPQVVDLVSNPTLGRIDQHVNNSAIQPMEIPDISHFSREHDRNQLQHMPVINKQYPENSLQQNNNRISPNLGNIPPSIDMKRPWDFNPSTSSAGNVINQPKEISQCVRDNVHSQVQPSTSGNKYCAEIYQKLRAMFPDIDKDYIKRFCPADWSPGMNQAIQLSRIVETVLQHENSWVISPKLNNSSIQNVEEDKAVVKPNVDDTYEYLTNVFPNADPHFLRKAAENFKNENDITAFIDDKLKNNNYPTREQYLAAMKVTEEQQRYTVNFNIEQFLTLLPDPFKHFEDPSRTCVYNFAAVEFLKVFFNRVRVITINKTYRLCNYNISLTARNLKKETDFIGTPRRSHEIPTNNISLLQEMAFVRHQDKIHQHMVMMKQKEEEEFNALKAAGGLWVCQCCFDEECMPSKCSKCDNGHIFCNSCIIDGTNSKLGDGETHIPCFLDCGSEFSIATLQKVLPPTKLCILLKKRQADEVMAAGLEGIVFCPFCHFASIPPEGDKVFKCFNPECMKESCIQCKEPNHVPYSCGELEDKQEKARKYIEEKMTQALTRTCYKCKKTFFKEEGCNKMQCPCGAIMCYICCQPVPANVGYKHFRGQGSDEVGKCPLWSDSMRLNAETVRKVEEEARKEILRQDPNIQIKTTVLAPALPQSRPGHHTELRQTQNIVDVLAARVLKSDRFGH